MSGEFIWRELMLRLYKHFKGRPLGILGCSIVFIVVLIAIIGPYISPFDPDALDLNNRFRSPIWMKGGNWDHALGTDMLGRDILSRLICGTRSSIIVGVSSALISLVLGVFLGMLSGY